MNIFLEILLTVIEVVLFFIFLFRILNIGFDKKIFTIVALIQITVQILVNSVFGIANYMGLIIIITSIVVIFKKISTSNIFNIFLTTIIGVGIMFFSELIIITTYSAFKLDPGVFISNPYYRLAGALLSKLLFYIIAIKIGIKIYKKIHTKELSKFAKKYKYIIISAFILCIILIYGIFSFYKYPNIDANNIRTYVLGISSAIIITTIVLWVILFKNINLIKKEIEWDHKEKEYNQQKIYIENINDIIKLLRAQRHDFRNHISCLYGLLETEKIDEAQKYINNLTQEVINYDNLINIENPIIASILNVKLLKAINQNINLETSINIPKNFLLKNIEITNIIGNLMDNAIEACQNVVYKHIDVSINIKDNYFVIKVINSKSKDIIIALEDDIIPTSKIDDIDNHGFGIQNIKKVVDKYNGLIKINDNVETFEVNIAIPLIN